MKNTLTKMNKDNNRKNLFTGLIASICLSFLLYGFGITGTTLSIADAKTNNRQVAELQTEIAELEIEYFEIVNTLSLEEASLLGMQEQEEVHYALVDQVKAVAYNNL